MKNSQKVGGSGSLVMSTSLASRSSVSVPSYSAGYSTRNSAGKPSGADTPSRNVPSTALLRSRMVTDSTAPARTAASKTVRLASSGSAASPRNRWPMTTSISTTRP